MGSDVQMPNDSKAEMALIGCLIRDSKSHAQVASVREEDFYSFPCRVCWRMISEMVSEGRSVDIVTLADRVHAKGFINDVTYPFIVDLFDAAPSSANIKYYAEIVIDRSKRRTIIHGCNELSGKAYDLTQPVQETTKEGGDLFFRTLSMGCSLEAKHQADVVRAFFEQVERQNRGRADGEIDHPFITSGWEGLDKQICGFHRSEFSIVAARPSIGKTVFAGCLAYRMASRGHPVLFCSLEQKDVAILQRMFSTVTRIPGYKITRGMLDVTDMDCILDHGPTMEALPIWWVDSPSQTVSQISAVAKRLKMKGRLDAVVVDYLQIIRPDSSKRGQSRTDEVGDISWGLKLLARELELPVIALAQLNRQNTNRVDSAPKLSDLRDSGRIEQDGDTILFLHKDQPPDLDRPIDEMSVIIGKQRNGPLGTVPLLHHKEIFDISDVGQNGGEF